MSSNQSSTYLSFYTQRKCVNKNTPPSSLLGKFLINADADHKKTVKSTKSNKGYHFRYPRTNKTYLRLSKAVEIMRYTYKYSMNNIGFGLQISTRTVKKYVDSMKKIGILGINLVRSRYHRSKNSSFKRRLLTIAARIQSYIDGQIGLLELYSALGIKPPPHRRGTNFSFF